MQTIFERNKELNKLQDILEYIRKYGINYEITKVTLEYLLTCDDKLLSNYKIIDNSRTTAIFYPKINSINISIVQLKNWVEANLNIKDEIKAPISDAELKAYLFLFVIAHEISHAHQYLISQSIIAAPYDVITVIYKDIITNILDKKQSIILGKEFIGLIRLILYRFQENSYILERNANVETIILLNNLAKYENNIDAINFFEEFLNLFLNLGYDDKYNGCVEKTYKKLLMPYKYKKLNTDEIIEESERIRYGLPKKQI